MTDHSQKSHEGGSRRSIVGSTEGITLITNKIKSLGRNIKKLKENVHAIWSEREHGRETIVIKEEVKRVEEAMAREASKTHLGPGNRAKYRMGPQGWYTKIENWPIYENTKISLEEMVNKHIEDSWRKNEKSQEWMNEMKVDTERNLRNQSAAIKNLKTQIGQLAKKYPNEEIRSWP